MKQIKERWLGLVIASALMALFGIASPAIAAPYDGPCANAPDFIDGDGTITDGACAGRTITATGALSVTSTGAVSAASLSGATLTVQGSSVTVPSLSSAFGSVVVNATGGAATLGTINAVNGSFSVTASTSVTASGALVSSYGPSVITASNGAVLVKDVTVTSGQVTITSTGGAITTDNVTASYELDIKSNGAFPINTKILTANNGNLKVDSGSTLTIVGLTKSTLYDIDLKSVNDLKTDVIEAGRNLAVTSTTGNVDTKDLTADQGTLKVKADIKITIVGITKTNKYDIDLDAKNIVKTNAITSGSHVRVNSTNENINITSTVDSNIDDTSGGNILLTANKSIITSSINTHGNTKVGAVRIVANKGGANTLFVIGTTATTNGVKGTITTNTVTGGGTNPTGFTFGISIQNGGTDTSAGGIKVVSMANLKVAASNSKAGTIILDAKNGILTLPAGTMNANAASGKQAGSIVLLAKTVTTASGTILSATQTAAAPGSGHSISIAAETLNLAGPTGLKIQTNGKGVTGFPALASLSPQGSVTVYSDDNSVFSLYWQLSNFASTTTAKPLTVAGAAPLTMISDGDESQVLASGHPLTFSNTDITLQSRGKTNHRVDVVYNGADDNSTNLVFNNSGTVTLDANGLGGAGGKVSVYGDKIALNAPTFNITASGPPSGNGNGGELYFRSTAATLNPASKVSFKADAALVGSGNAIKGDMEISSEPKAITFFPGAVNVNIGTIQGQYSFSANGGKTGGNAGTIQVSSLPVKVQTIKAMSAAALGGTGNGGEIFFYSQIIDIHDPASTSADSEIISVNGSGTGLGGKFTANYSGFNFDVIKEINVNGGTGVVPGNFDGFIKLNGTKCQQILLQTQWPRGYWHCPILDTQAPVAIDQVPFNFANGTALATQKTVLSQKKTVIFVFEDPTASTSFFNLGGTQVEIAGATFKGIEADNNLTLYVTVSKRVPKSGGTVALTEESLTEVTAHEFGHALDISSDRDSHTGVYINRLYWDFATLDYTFLGVDRASSTPRHPCVGINAPFAGVKDSAGVAVCDNLGNLVNTAYAGKVNSFIARDLTYIFGVDSAGYFVEPYAHAIAYRGYAIGLTPAQFFNKPADGIFVNNQFACIQGTASFILGGASTPPSYCDTSLIGWYKPYGEE